MWKKLLGRFPQGGGVRPAGSGFRHPGRIADEGSGVPRGGNGLEVGQPGGGVQQTAGGKAEGERAPQGGGIQLFRRIQQLGGRGAVGEKLPRAGEDHRRGGRVREAEVGAVDAVGGKMTIFVDGAIRSGMDMFKALALGADAVLIGRPFVTTVYGGGEEGVQLYVQKLKAELADTMRMCGAHTLADIDRSMLYGF